MEREKGEKQINYAALNHEFDELSPTRPAAGKESSFEKENAAQTSLFTATVLSSFDKEINQMSTPLHHRPNDNTVKGKQNEEIFPLADQRMSTL